MTQIPAHKGIDTLDAEPAQGRTARITQGASLTQQGKSS
jgi:hypothetical protein